MQTDTNTWPTTLRTLLHPRVITLLFLGFSAGLPYLLIFSSLGIWLREAAFDKSVVTFFALAGLGYSFKFVWAPLVDQLPLPWLTRLLGRRRAWMLLAQVFIACSILVMASIDPQASDSSLTMMAMAAVMLGFSSATQDIAIDAYRIESAGIELQAMMSATYIAGYRIGWLVAGAGSLYLADWFGTSMDAYNYQAWQWAYCLMASTMLVGIITTLVIKEPDNRHYKNQLDNKHDAFRFLLLFALVVTSMIGTYHFSSEPAAQAKVQLTKLVANRFLSAFVIESVRLLLALLAAWFMSFMAVKAGLVRYAMVKNTYLVPIHDFFSRYGWSLALILLSLIGLYRISDIVLGVISNIFYQDMGFSKSEIASVTKGFGLLMTIIGGFLGGLLALRFGVMRMLLLGAVLSALTNLLFMVLANVGYDIIWLYVVISADNLSAGIASAAFVAFLSSLTHISFTAMQYAIFSSMMTLIPKVLGGYSGSMVEAVGYQSFFLITALLGVPVLLLILLTAKRLENRACDSGFDEGGAEE